MSWRRDRRDGEAVLASCVAADGTILAGTRSHLYLGDHRVSWDRVEAAEWDRDTDTWRVSEVGTWGEQRPEHAFTLARPTRFLELARERITSTVVLQRHVAVQGRRGVRVIARRSPAGTQKVSWIFEYDAGIDPDDPLVQAAAEAALRAAQDEVGTA